MELCDRCIAAAKVVVTLNAGSELQFCGHHWNQHELVLVRQITGIRHLAVVE